MDHLSGFNALRDPHRLALLGGQVLLRIIVDYSRHFFLLWQIVIDHFAMVYFTVPDRSCGGFPALIRLNNIPAAVLVSKFDLSDDCCSFSVMAALVIKTENTFIPPVADCDLNAVLLFKISCDVVGLVLKSLLIRSPSGRESILADPLSIQMYAVHAEGRDICSCLGDLFRRGKVSCKYSRGFHLI